MKPNKAALIAAAIAGVSGVATFAALLGIGPALGLPKIDFVGPSPSSGTLFDAGSRALSIQATPISSNFGSAIREVTPPEGLSINLLVNDHAGQVVASVAGDDFVLTGNIDQDGDSVIDYSGVLLTGEVLAIGSLATTLPTDFMDFRFRATGGSLMPLYSGKDIGVTLTMEASTFGGTFASSFTAGAKGFVGPIPCAGKIGDFVWHDLNRDGLQDPGEPGLNGVPVTLSGTDAWGTPIAMATVTGPGPMGQQGYYQFTPLCGGTYTVTAATPTGFQPTDSLVGSDTGVDSNGSPTTVTLTGLSDQTLDFGFVTECTGTIGDFVWHDLNRNGLQDAGEPGIDGVDVTLVNPADNSVIATTVTGPNGFYSFGGLCAGSYQVVVDETDLPPTFTPTPTLVGSDTGIDSNPNPYVVTLPADNTSDLTIDFGYQTPCTGELGDFVWYDKNQNGLQDAGEAGIAGVTVRLKDGADMLLATTTTGANGLYGFTGLCAGTYKVEVDHTTIPAGFSPTLVEVGADQSIDSNPNPYTITLPNDFASDLRIDFGYIAPCTGQIGDFVWKDLDQDGIQDAGEPGIPGVTVNLKDTSNTVIQTDTTDANGLYLFNGLCPGDYRVEVVPPAGAVASPTLQGGNTSVDSNPNPSPVTLLFDDTVDLTHDFGFYYPPASLGDFVWEDLNRDGTQDAGEPGIDGVVVDLLNCGNPAAIASTLTAGGGAYLFSNLDAGCYQVRFGLPAGYSRTLQNVGSDDDDSDADVATGLTGNYTLAWGEFNPTVDSGLYRPAQLGDYVWIDSDGDGIQDAGETQGVVGATATLHACVGGVPGAAIAGPQVIGASGLYLYTNLVPGSYAVKFTLPSGYVFTTQNAGGDDAQDSDANPSTGFSQCVTLASGEQNLTIDAGAVVPAICVPADYKDYSFTGSTATDGTNGNIRTYSFTGFSVKVSAWRRDKSSNNWTTAYLGAYSSGLGVTDPTEGDGSGDRHTVDNVTATGSYTNNFVLFEFSEPVIVNRAFLDYVGVDSDIQVWVGTFSNPYVNHLNLNDTVVGLFGHTEFDDGFDGYARWAAFNGGEVAGNALLIAPRPDGTNDSFKLRKLTICVPNTPAAALGDYVWDDADQDGIQDAGEVGIDGATVRLLDAANNVLATRTTGDNPGLSGTQKGYYEFAGLTPGVTYKVQFVMPSGYDIVSPRQAGANTAIDSDGLLSDPVVLADGEFNRTIDAGFARSAPVCVITDLSFTGSTATSGTKGNIRTYTFGSLTVKVSAFSRIKSTGAWYTAYLGAYSNGLGVTDGGEGDGSNNRHTVDNYDRNNYVLFEFSAPVVVDQAYLDYVQTDSDISVWFGQNPNGSNPYFNHMMLSDSLLNNFSVKETNTTSSSTARWANINGAGAGGNALVISTVNWESNDSFKLRKVKVCK
jgi:hypothetical protein